MIDFIKADVYGLDPADLLQNDLIDFKGNYNMKTGEIYDDLLEGTFRHLKISITNQKYVKISGSLHKFFTDGINYDDFTYSKLLYTLQYLERNFGIILSKCPLRNLEFGVNISLNYNPHDFIKHIIHHKGSEFNKMRSSGKSIGKDLVRQQYTIKIYNKGMQAKLPYHLFRFEIKVVKMKFLDGLQIKTLNDLLDKRNLKDLMSLLLAQFDEILFHDKNANLSKLKKDDREFMKSAKYPGYWSDLKDENLPKFNYNRRKYKKIFDTYKSDILTDIRNGIENMFSKLVRSDVIDCTNLTVSSLPIFHQNNHSSGMDNPVKLGVEVRLCQRCHKEIIDRKKEARYCSERCRKRDEKERERVYDKLKKSCMHYMNSNTLFDPDPYVDLTDHEKALANTLYAYTRDTRYKIFAQA